MVVVIATYTNMLCIPSFHAGTQLTPNKNDNNLDQTNIFVLNPCTSLKKKKTCLVGLVVKASALRPEDLGFESHLRREFSSVESYQ